MVKALEGGRGATDGGLRIMYTKLCRRILIISADLRVVLYSDSKNGTSRMEQECYADDRLQSLKIIRLQEDKKRRQQNIYIYEQCSIMYYFYFNILNYVMNAISEATPSLDPPK